MKTSDVGLLIHYTSLFYDNYYSDSYHLGDFERRELRLLINVSGFCGIYACGM